jgi:T5SS/PEP-CTERM-associated repeat protein
MFDGSQGIFNFEDGVLTVDGGVFSSQSGINVSGAFNPVLILDNGASSSSADLAAIGAQAGRTGTLDIRNGSTVQSGGVVGVLGGNGTVNVDGAGSSWQATEGLVIGDEPNLALQLLGISDAGIGLVSVANSAVLDTAFNDVRINRQGTLDLAGGDVFARNLDVNGTVRGFGTVYGRVIGSAHSVISATGGTLSLGGPGLINSFASDGLVNVGSGATLHIETIGTFASLASQNILSGGSITSTYAVVLGAGRSLIGNGAVDTRFIGAGGSLVVANGGDLTLGDASAVDGYFSDGDLDTDTHTVTINDANTAVLGSLTQLGNGVTGGTLAAGNATPGDTLAHLFIEEGKNLVGRGNVIGNVKNNGAVIGDGTGFDERLIFDAGWTVSGKGTFENTLVFGTFAPGESPAISNGRNQAFAGVVEIELGGLLPGSGSDNHDQINDSGTIDLFGSPTLSILSFNGFIPEVGDAFTVLTWAIGLNGTFGDIALDPLFASSGLRFDLIFTDTDGSGSLTLVAAAPVPIPAMGWLFGIAAASLFVRNGRRKTAR